MPEWELLFKISDAAWLALFQSVFGSRASELIVLRSI